MFKKIKKFYNNRSFVKKRRKRKRLKKQKEKQQEFIRLMKDLQGFIKWINNEGLPNRRARKNFWKDLKDGVPNLNKTLGSLMTKYIQMNKKIDKELNRVKEKEENNG